MDRNGGVYAGEPTAFDENLEEVVYHLILEPEAAESLRELNDTEISDECVMCGGRAVWYSSEIQTEEAFTSDQGRVTRCWCDQCMPDALIDTWRDWPWTPDEELADSDFSSTFNPDDDGQGLRGQENTPVVILHLDMDADSESVSKVLQCRGVPRSDATCDECGGRADWYRGRVIDVFREYDFDAARENALLCDECMDDESIKKWERRPWTAGEPESF